MAWLNAGKSIAARIAMIAITTSSSIKVKPPTGLLTSRLSCRVLTLKTRFSFDLRQSPTFNLSAFQRYCYHSPSASAELISRLPTGASKMPQTPHHLLHAPVPDNTRKRLSAERLHGLFSVCLETSCFIIRYFSMSSRGCHFEILYIRIVENRMWPSRRFPL